MTFLVGHEAQFSELLDAAGAGRLHHAWLLAGPAGIGKASFAHLIAERLLSDAAGRPVADLIAAGSHPDLRVLERLVDEKTGAVARGINIEQVRALGRFFGTTGSLSSRRVVIIDAIDDLERAGANALLKNLEEPPADCLFLLISHAPGRLLPTIRSRCRMLRFQTLDDAAMASVLRRQLPDAGDAEISALTGVGEGSPGRALAFAGLDIAGLDAAIDRLMREGDPTNAERAKLAKALALKAAQPRYEAFLARVPTRIAEQARALSGERLVQALKAWDDARMLAQGAVGLSLDAQSTVFALGGMLATLAPPRE